MLKFDVHLMRHELVELQEWLDEHVPGWMHDTPGMSWDEHNDRYQRNVEKSQTSPMWRPDVPRPCNLQILVPTSTLGVLVALRWDARHIGIRGKPALPLLIGKSG